MFKIDLTKKYVLAVSGGIDSMAMLYYFASLLPRPDFSVVTVNHGIRKEAQADCEFVKNYCQQLGVECQIYSVNVPEYRRENKLSEETSARLLRYGILDGLQCDYICLAHHKSDNAETVLMHILRGSGPHGACGISRESGKYIRPLLDWSKKDIEHYVNINGIPFVNDSTNSDTKYTRNFMRLEVMPLLKTINSEVEDNIIRFADNIALDNGYLDSLADISTVEFSDNKAAIPLDLLSQHKAISYRVLRKTFAELGVFKDIEKTHIEAILDLLNGQGGKKVYLPFGYIAVNDYNYITLEKFDAEEITYFEIPFAVGRTVTPVGVVGVSEKQSENSLMIDLNKMPSNAVIRLKRQGDVFEKFGGGTKTLKKYLIDEKIPQRKRQRLPLIASGNEVLVICGVEISEKLKVNDDSKVYYISLEKENVL